MLTLLSAGAHCKKRPLYGPFKTTTTTILCNYDASASFVVTFMLPYPCNPGKYTSLPKSFKVAE